MGTDTTSTDSQSSDTTQEPQIDPKDKTEYSQLLYVNGLLISTVGIATYLFLFMTPLYNINPNFGLYILYLGVGLTLSSIICESRINSALDAQFR